MFEKNCTVWTSDVDGRWSRMAQAQAQVRIGEYAAMISDVGAKCSMSASSMKISGAADPDRTAKDVSSLLACGSVDVLTLGGGDKGCFVLAIPRHVGDAVLSELRTKAEECGFSWHATGAPALAPYAIPIAPMAPADEAACLRASEELSALGAVYDPRLVFVPSWNDTGTWVIPKGCDMRTIRSWSGFPGVMVPPTDAEGFIDPMLRDDQVRFPPPELFENMGAIAFPGGGAAGNHPLTEDGRAACDLPVRLMTGVDADYFRELGGEIQDGGSAVIPRGARLDGFRTFGLIEGLPHRLSPLAAASDIPLPLKRPQTNSPCRREWMEPSERSWRIPGGRDRAAAFLAGAVPLVAPPGYGTASDTPSDAVEAPVRTAAPSYAAPHSSATAPLSAKSLARIKATATSPEAKQALDYAERLSVPMPLLGTVDPEALKNALMSEFPWQGAAVREIVRSVSMRKFGDKAHFRLRPTLFVGPAGTGKTRFMRRVCELVGLPCKTLPCSTISDSISFSGSSKEFKGAEPSWPVRMMLQSNCANPGLILDEIDKLGTSRHNGNVADAILPCLEPETSSTFEDKFLGESVDLSEVTWLFTANSTEGLGEPFLSRVSVVRTGSPLPEHADAIIRGIVVDLEKAYGIAAGRLPPIPPQTMSALRQTFAHTRSIRRIVKDVERHYGAEMSPEGTAALGHRPRKRENLRMTAVHEAGHAIVSACGGAPRRVAKLTIEPDDELGALGYMLPAFEEDGTHTLTEMKARLATDVAGRVAERLVYGPDTVGAGAQSDIRAAQTTAWDMVVRWGMSALGVVPADREGRPVSAQLSERVGDETERLLLEADKSAAECIEANRAAFDGLVEALMERTTLDAEDIDSILGSCGASPHAASLHFAVVR